MHNPWVTKFTVLGMLCVACGLSAFLFLLHAAAGRGKQGDFMPGLNRRVSLIIGLISLAAAVGFFLPCYFEWKETTRPVGIDEIQNDLERKREGLLRQRLDKEGAVGETFPAERIEQKKAEQPPEPKTEEEGE